MFVCANIPCATVSDRCILFLFGRGIPEPSTTESALFVAWAGLNPSNERGLLNCWRLLKQFSIMLHCTLNGICGQSLLPLRTFMRKCCCHVRLAYEADGKGKEGGYQPFNRRKGENISWLRWYLIFALCRQTMPTSGIGRTSPSDYNATNTDMICSFAR